MRLSILCPALIVSAAVSAGCLHTRDFLEPTSPAPISHIVLVRMQDPSKVDQLIAESVRDLGAIPAVTTLAVGRHLETGRENIIRDYDVALYVGFRDTNGYTAYVDDPRHVAFVERWKPYISSLDVRDFTDDRR